MTKTWYMTGIHYPYTTYIPVVLFDGRLNQKMLRLLAILGLKIPSHAVRSRDEKFECLGTDMFERMNMPQYIGTMI